MEPIQRESGSDEFGGLFGVTVRRTRSKFNDTASMEVRHDESVDYEHTLHRSVVPWDGCKASVKNITKMLNFSKVPIYVQNISAINMILRLIDNICLKKDVIDEQGVKLDSILVLVTTDQDNGDYSEFAEFFPKEDSEDSEFAEFFPEQDSQD